LSLDGCYPKLEVIHLLRTIEFGETLTASIDDSDNDNVNTITTAIAIAIAAY
jgi:hypothetical protein